MIYHIVIKDHIDNKRMNRFEGMSIHLNENGETLLTGSVPDQSGLYAILTYIRDSGLTLVSLQQTEDISENR